MSLCADEPGAGSGWADPTAQEVTCLACLKRLERLGIKTDGHALLLAQARDVKAALRVLPQDAK